MIASEMKGQGILKGLICLIAASTLIGAAPKAAVAESQRHVTLTDVDAALVARDAGRWEDFLAKMQLLITPHPNQPTFRFLLAQAHARNGNGTDAVKQLRWLSERGYAYAARSHPAFEKLLADAAFVQVASRLEANSAVRIGHASTISTFDRNDVRPEGIAFDPRSRRYLVSSALNGSIYAVDNNGALATIWTELRSGFESVGIRISPSGNRRAVFCSNAASGEDEISELIEFDLRTGQQVAKISLPRPSNNRTFCNDIAAVGSGYAVTDSEGGMIWLIDRFLKHVKPGVGQGLLLYPNGIAATDDGNIIYVADMLGLNMISTSTGQVRKFELAGELSLAGIDGLYFQTGRLIGIQNGTSPERVVEIHLDRAMVPKSARVVAQGLSGLTELTTAVVRETKVIALSRTGIGRSVTGASDFPHIIEICLSACPKDNQH